MDLQTSRDPVSAVDPHPHCNDCDGPISVLLSLGGAGPHGGGLHPAPPLILFMLTPCPSEPMGSLTAADHSEHCQPASYMLSGDLPPFLPPPLPPSLPTMCFSPLSLKEKPVLFFCELQEATSKGNTKVTPAFPATRCRSHCTGLPSLTLVSSLLRGHCQVGINVLPSSSGCFGREGTSQYL